MTTTGSLPLNPATLIARANRVIDAELSAVEALKTQLADSFIHACELMLSCRGRVVVTGMGKSGHIGGKIAATLASTGTPAFFVHPGEASHGDLGMITAADVVLALSNSGATDEILTILPVIKRLGVPLIAMTGHPDSPLAREANSHITIHVEREACPHNLAPTSSTTAALVMGDAMAVVLLQSRNFSAEDFARSHPAGSLGRRLLLTVADLMHTQKSIPQVEPETTVGESLIEMSHKGLGMTNIVDNTGQLCGIFTDGDLRRLLDHGHIEFYQQPISSVMQRQFTTIPPNKLAAEALALMERKRINALPVVDKGELVGTLNMHDLLRARVV
ncbi:KpsF/GutQ family sugar-phosphate isomerase [Ectothiorhodospiraceae bacterium BW-2]|nr:KpsF/GutQ family sugar-phosphate isomerase [Ectothiorhodospiraceae bacterium BW-2]